jgi:hypothetical protein
MNGATSGGGGKETITYTKGVSGSSVRTTPRDQLATAQRAAQ